MALPGHSPPPPFQGPGSPPRQMNGYHDHQSSFPIYGPQPRPMPPPSPQHYSRYSQPPLPPSLPSINYHNEHRAQPAPYKRPSSSMSISSMLGSEPERDVLRQDPLFHSRSLSRQPVSNSNGPSMPLSAVMSPPQQPPKPVAPEYSYKPRSQTPDHSIFGTRPHRSSSGSFMQRPSYQEQVDRMQSSRFPEQPPPPSFGNSMPSRDEAAERAAERARRTSLSGILQRPDSAPQRPPLNGHQYQSASEFSQPETAAVSALNGSGFSTQSKPSGPQRPVQTGSYDTRPPPFLNVGRPPPSSQNTGFKDFAKVREKRESQSHSPELRRPQLNGEPRGLAGLLNDPTPTASNMMRQDSIQSQSDRSIFGDRFGRGGAYSPFAPSVASQTMSITSAPLDDNATARKGSSDELSAHRTILGLHAESKRGRYSPVPQAVQGAQAQTPVPDVGIKKEPLGRVFSGLGGASMPGPTSTPQPTGMRESPFKQADGGASRLSEENLMKISRSTSGVTKRARKYDADPRAESEAGMDGRKKAKRGKYAHAYKLGIEDGVAPSEGRGTPLLGVNGKKSVTSNPLSHTIPASNYYEPQQVQTRVEDKEPIQIQQIFKPRKTIRIGGIIEAANKQARRHLGNFVYKPIVDYADVPSARSSLAENGTASKFEVAVRPNLLPCFNGEKQVNCTYAIRVPKLWLGIRERKLISRERALWGSGIYTDDSDVVAAAMHAGWIRSGNLEGDEVQSGGSMLARIVSEQNSRIEGGFPVPEQPMEIESGKDLIITVVVLPYLERYPGSARFGITSRNWPDVVDKSDTPHDGVSFSILKAEFVSGGMEGRRMGRTGKERRDVLKSELKANQMVKAEIKRRFEQARRSKVQETKTKTSSKASEGKISTKRGGLGGSGLRYSSTNQPAPVSVSAVKQHNVALSTTDLDVGQAPGDWLKNADL